MSGESLRESFEKFAATKFANIYGTNLFARESPASVDTKYSDPIIEAAWTSWRQGYAAGAAAMQERAEAIFEVFPFRDRAAARAIRSLEVT